MFSHHGYLDEIVTDNRTQFSSREFVAFVQSQSIKHTTSTPLFLQSNDMTERSVQTAKQLIRPSLNPLAALWPTELRCWRTAISQLSFCTVGNFALPGLSHSNNTVWRCQILLPLSQQKQWQKHNFHACHNAKDSLPLSKGSKVIQPDCQETRHVVSQPGYRSYVISIASDDFRRNWRDINPLPKEYHPASTTASNRANLTLTQPTQERPHQTPEHTPPPTIKQSVSAAPSRQSSNQKWTCKLPARQAHVWHISKRKPCKYWHCNMV